MSIKIVIKALLVLGLVSGYAQSGETVCEGKVEQLAFHANNSFLLKLSSMNTPVIFCNPDAVWTAAGTPYTTGPETCKMLYSTFLSAQMAGKSLSAVYFDGDDSKGNCQSFPAWAKVNIRHFVLTGN
ncbi:hypothetical protein [Rheinheimera soli]|uniref:hypothetical protein n=1 Tax=Rheinheimera soli TaxID=443616 RepID=UPI001E4810DB|nr:hypothetical protein [Rheinheimera soli]